MIPKYFKGSLLLLLTFQLRKVQGSTKQSAPTARDSDLLETSRNHPLHRLTRHGGNTPTQIERIEARNVAWSPEAAVKFAAVLSNNLPKMQHDYTRLAKVLYVCKSGYMCEANVGEWPEQFQKNTLHFYSPYKALEDPRGKDWPPRKGQKLRPWKSTPRFLGSEPSCLPFFGGQGPGPQTATSH